MRNRRHLGLRALHCSISRMTAGFRTRGFLRGLLVCAAATLLSSCQLAGVMDPRGPIAAQERLLMINTTEIMLVVVVPVIMLTLGFAWWYRAANPRADHSPEWAYQGG